MKANRRRDWSWVLVPISYLLLAAAYAWPLIRRLTVALAGDGFDMYVFQWGNWWITESLGSGQSPYHTSMVFYPQGASLYFLSFSWFNTFIWWVLRPLAGGIAAYNLTVWWSWPLSAIGGYLLAKEITGDRRAAFIAGLVYAFYPYHFAQRNHLNLLSVQWIPLSLFFMIRGVRCGKMWYGVMAGFFLACSGLSGWHLLTLSLMLGGLWVLYSLLTEACEWTAGSWRALLVLAVTLPLLAGPLLVPIAWEQLVNPEGQDSYLGKEGETQTDLVAYFVPNLYHPLWGDLAAPFHQHFLRNKDHAVTLGYVPLMLLGYGVLRWRKLGRRQRFWFFGLLFFWLLALGPFPRVNGVAYPSIPLPYRLFGWTLPVRSLRNPERFNILVGLCLALTTSIGLGDLAGRLPRRKAGLAAVAVGLLVLVEYWAWPFPTTEPEVPEFYHQLAAAEGDAAIVDLPITNDLSKLYMYYQTVHERPTVTGHVSRPPEGAYDFISSIPFLDSMWQTRRPPEGGRLSEDLVLLAESDVEYIIVHRARMDSGGWEAWQLYADVEPISSGEDIYVYSIGEAR